MDCFQLPLLLLSEGLLVEDLVVQAVVFADAQLRQPSVQTLQQHAGLAQTLAGDVAAAFAGSLHRHLHPVPHRQVLPRVDDVHYRARPDALQVLQKGPRMATISIGGVDTFSGKVVQLLKVSVQNNFFLICIFEGLAARHDAFTLAGCGDGRAAAQTSYVPSQDVHHNSLCNVISIVTWDKHNNNNTILNL